MTQNLMEIQEYIGIGINYHKSYGFCQALQENNPYFFYIVTLVCILYMSSCINIAMHYGSHV